MKANEKAINTRYNLVVTTKSLAAGINQRHKLFVTARGQANGITLIALVITIVVLIILAGVSINVLLGENGIITRAKTAKTLVEKTNAIEEIQLKLLEIEQAKVEQGDYLTNDDIINLLISQSYVAENANTGTSENSDIVVDENGNLVNFKVKGKDFRITLAEIYGGSLLNKQVANGSWSTKKKVNTPELLDGMTPIKFSIPTNTSMGQTVKTLTDDEDWYEYGTSYDKENDTTTKRWANAQTKDGSMWVWIPRYAYRINSEEQTTSVVFLIGKTDKYYDEEGNLQTAKRCNRIDEAVDTTTGYTVHPAFTDESKIDFRNGGWDSELSGIWVAKFEAGFASGNNTAPVVASEINYTYITSNIEGVESPNSTTSVNEPARNWLDGIYVVENQDSTYSWKDGRQTSIKYPTFQGTTYSMNYITISDSYNIARNLTGKNNIYGFSSNTNSHLMKNSEWGAVSYLTRSQYGLYNVDITVNNATLNSGGNARIEIKGKNGVDSVYAVTGCTSNSTNVGANITTIESINAITGNTANEDGIYVWNQKIGQGASTTGTIYGIYDMSGGLSERMPDYIATNNNGIAVQDNLKRYGSSFTYKGDMLVTKSTKYATVYPNNELGQTNANKASQLNFASNTLIYGDSIRETTSSKAGTSESGWNESAWCGGRSWFPHLGNPFFGRGGTYGNGGLINYVRFNGNSTSGSGMRACIVALPAI